MRKRPYNLKFMGITKVLKNPIILLVYCLLCCTACQKIPDEVNQDVEAYKKSGES
jgi:hypothetical protein